LAPAFALAQSPARVGYGAGDGTSQSQAIKGLGEGLKQLGYQERKNLFFETRNVKGNRAALQPAAGELLARNVTVIFYLRDSATRARWRPPGIPIVFIHPGDPLPPA